MTKFCTLALVSMREELSEYTAKVLCFFTSPRTTFQAAENRRDAPRISACKVR